MYFQPRVSRLKAVYGKEIDVFPLIIERSNLMKQRPVGVTILAILAGVAAVLAAINALQFLGILPFFVGPVAFRTFSFGHYKLICSKVILLLCSFVGGDPVGFESVSVIAFRLFPYLTGDCLPLLMYPLSPGRRHRRDPNVPGCRAIRSGRALPVKLDQREGGHRPVPGQESRAKARAAPRWPRLAGYMRSGIPPETLSVHEDNQRMPPVGVL